MERQKVEGIGHNGGIFSLKIHGESEGGEKIKDIGEIISEVE